MSFASIKRGYQVISIALHYGLDELLPKINPRQAVNG